MSNAKPICIFDLTKFILSLFVVSVHISSFPKLFYPWIVVGVPLFFMISSYLFFGKVKSLGDRSPENGALKSMSSAI